MQCLCDLKLVIENHILAVIKRYTVMFPQGHNVYVRPADVGDLRGNPDFDHQDNHLLHLAINQSHLLSGEPVKYTAMQPS